MAPLALITIDLADSGVRAALTAAAMAWGIGVIVIVYSLWTDIAEWRRGRQPKRAERRFIEPCADTMHAFKDGTCTHCKAAEPQTPPS